MPSRDEFGCLEVSNDDGLNFEDQWLSPAGLFCIEAGRLVIVHVPWNHPPF